MRLSPLSLTNVCRASFPILLLSFVAGACANDEKETTDISEQFFSDYQGTLKDSTGDVAQFNADRTFRFDWTGQVGAKLDKDLPFPTRCDWYEAGSVTSVSELPTDQREFAQQNTYELELEITEVGLLPPRTLAQPSDPNCQNLLARKQNGLPSKRVLRVRVAPNMLLFDLRADELANWHVRVP